MVDLPSGFADAFSSLEAAQKLIANIGTVAAQAYFTNKLRAQPIVAHHFTRGNVQRYGWPDIKRDTLAQKLGKAKASNALAKAEGRRTTGVDKSQGKGTLPVLVRTGAMRQEIETGARIVRQSADHLRIVWQVAAYVAWHHTGGSRPGRPPKRSPIEPCQADVDEIREVVEQYVQQSIGNGRVRFRPTT
jgi:hypothetical protein